MSTTKKLIQHLHATLSKLPHSSKNHLALAFSGGIDSTILAVLLSKWRNQYSTTTKLTSITIDHQLRKNSALETEQVEKMSKYLNFDAHATLTCDWSQHNNNQNIPTSAIQQLARHQRYQLLTKKCTELNISHLLIGHHEKDQIETFLMRLLRNSGIDGLKSMTESTSMSSIANTTSSSPNNSNLHLLRPLLKINKNILENVMEENEMPYGLSPLEDPSNVNVMFDRVRARTAIDTYIVNNKQSSVLHLYQESLKREELMKEETENVIFYYDNSADKDELHFKLDQRMQEKDIEMEMNRWKNKEILKELENSKQPLMQSISKLTNALHTTSSSLQIDTQDIFEETCNVIEPWGSVYMHDVKRVMNGKEVPYEIAMRVIEQMLKCTRNVVGKDVFAPRRKTTLEYYTFINENIQKKINTMEKRRSNGGTDMGDWSTMSGYGAIGTWHLSGDVLYDALSVLDRTNNSNRISNSENVDVKKRDLNMHEHHLVNGVDEMDGNGVPIFLLTKPGFKRRKRGKNVLMKSSIDLNVPFLFENENKNSEWEMVVSLREDDVDGLMDVDAMKGRKFYVGNSLPRRHDKMDRSASRLITMLTRCAPSVYEVGMEDGDGEVPVLTPWCGGSLFDRLEMDLKRL